MRYKDVCDHRRKIVAEKWRVVRLRNAHVISYDWEDFSPILTVYHAGELLDIPMAEMKRMDLSASKGIWCIGSFRDGEYHPCPENAAVGGFRQCVSCAEPVIPVLSCIFEPRCDGSLCGVEFCSREHAVYIAFFGRLVKVGMTSFHRARKRAIEQGADSFSIIKRLPNRLAARNFEKYISSEYGISQAHSAKAVLGEMARRTEKDGINREFTRILMDIGEDLDDIPEMMFLEEYPIELPLRRPPVLRASATRHEGRIIGIKGRYLIYERSGIYAVDLSDMVGRRINADFL